MKKKCVYLTNYCSFERSFERSFDIYYAPENPSKTNKYPILIMAMGSGWLGHTPLIYTISNWWNKTLAINLGKEGVTCIYIRHRGACIQVSKLIYVGVSIFFLLLNYYYTFEYGKIFLPLLPLLYWDYISSGDARYNTMISDIADCLSYIYKNRLDISKSTGSNGNFIVGGYSSGSHILLSVLQSGILQSEKYNMPPINKLYSALLFVSGVFSTSPFPCEQEEFCFTAFIRKTFLQAIFKNSYPEVIKRSPIHNIDKLPRNIPYIISYCRNEIFSIKWIEDTFSSLFSSRQFIEQADKINKNDLPIVSLELECNHWTILNSDKLIEFIITHI